MSISIFFEPMHADARRCRQRSLAAGKESREQQADKDDQDREPIVGGHCFASFCIRKARTSAASIFGAIKAAPISRVRMKVSLLCLTFLSWVINCIRRSASAIPLGS